MKEELNEVLLAKYFAEEANKEELLLIKDWLESDKDNATRLRQYQQIWESQQKNIRFEPNVDLAWKKVSKQIFKQKKINFVPWAAAIAGIIMLSTFFWVNRAEQFEYSSLKTEKNQKEKTLADGSIITLNAFSLLEYPETFSKSERRVKLIGEAFFDISKRPDKPFIIEANGTEIRVLGTSFNISARDENVKVSVNSGTVEFSASPKEKVILQQGDEAQFESQKDTIKVAPILDKNVFAFKTKVFEFKQTKLEKVVEILNRGYQSNIRLEGNSWENYQLTTHFENEKLTDALDIIASTLDLKVKMENETYVLVKNIKSE